MLALLRNLIVYIHFFCGGTGIEDCPICYSAIHATTYQVPDKVSCSESCCCVCGCVFSSHALSANLFYVSVHTNTNMPFLRIGICVLFVYLCLVFVCLLHSSGFACFGACLLARLLTCLYLLIWSVGWLLRLLALRARCLANLFGCVISLAVECLT